MHNYIGSFKGVFFEKSRNGEMGAAKLKTRENSKEKTYELIGERTETTEKARGAKQRKRRQRLDGEEISKAKHVP